MQDIIKISEILSAVKWYFELKNLSLKNALSLRCPLTAGNQNDLRQYYSQYFAGLLSATELLLEKEYSRNLDFKEALYQKLVFEGHPNGEKNYAYLRELRNSIIHRGLDIGAAAHVKDDFPMIIAPSPVTNRNGAVSHSTFGYYLINVIEKCESVIGNVFLEHFENFNLFKMKLSQEKAIELSKQFILNSTVMPEQIKDFALKAVEDINYEEIHQASVKDLVEVLKTQFTANNAVNPFPS